MIDIKEQKLLYHLTSLEELSSIIFNKLNPRAKLKKFHDIVDQVIIESSRKHKCEDYVLFYWFSKKPLDGRVEKDKAHGKFDLITVKREVAQKENWKKIPMHLLTASDVNLYDYDEDIKLINWYIIIKRDYNNSECKQIYIAEYLLHSIVNISKFFMICIPTIDIKNSVISKLNERSVAIAAAMNQGIFS